MIGITLGDVCGIGPEIVAKALTVKAIREVCQPVVVGSAEVLQDAITRYGVPIQPRETSLDQLGNRVTIDANEALVWNPAVDLQLSGLKPGEPNGIAGAAAERYLRAAAKAALAGTIDAICTAPLHKKALAAGGSRFPGHTEILADVAGVSQYAMMLYLPAGDNVQSPFGLGVAHTTLHTSIASVPAMLTVSKVHQTIELVHHFMKSLGVNQPRVGVCALNPHAGEEGLFGSEEIQVIAPAIKRAVDDGIHALGPIPADALFRIAFRGTFDGIVAMYHDQGHIAFKLIGAEQAVNVTLGLPIVRTSPSHGTAFDIAGKGIANPEGMVAAIVLAAKLAQDRAGG